MHLFVAKEVTVLVSGESARLCQDSSLMKHSPPGQDMKVSF